MAEQLSLHTQIHATINGQETAVDIIATSAQELLDTINALVAGAQGNGVAGTQQAAPAPQPAPQAQATQPAATQPSPQPTPQPAPQPQQTAQPGPSAAATAQPGPATPSATVTAEQPSQPQLTVNDVLGPARQLLQQAGGEDTLRKILANHGAEAISTADPAQFGNIKAAIEQSLAGQ